MATYYIATTGNDTTGTGTLVNPWLTLAKGLTGSTTGDTLVFAAGTYTPAANSNLTGRTIQGATGGSATSTTGWTVFSGGGSQLYFRAEAGTTNVYNIWFYNILNNSAFGLIGTSGASTVTVARCRFSSVTVYSGTNYAGLIGSSVDWYSRINSLTIYGCVFDDIQENLQGNANYMLMGGRGNAAGSVFRYYNNVFHIKTSAKKPVSLFGGYNGDTLDYQIKNSIFLNEVASINFICDTPGTFSTLTFTNCCYNGTWANGAATPTYTNCITSAPLFVDDDNGDYRLRPTSPCLETGTII